MEDCDWRFVAEGAAGRLSSFPSRAACVVRAGELKMLTTDFTETDGQKRIPPWENLPKEDPWSSVPHP